MIGEEIEATKEIAKTAGKAIDAGREFGKFISKFIVGSLEQGVGIFEDKLKYMRWERQVSFMEKATERLANRGLELPNRMISMKIAIPLFQAASVEDDDYLQSIWANLLVNAADKDSGIEVRRNFISILQDLSVLEVQILEKIYSMELEPGQNIWICDLPEKVWTEKPPDFPRGPNETVSLALSNLCRLGLIESIMFIGDGGTSMRSVYQTVLGRKLYEACSSKEMQ